MAQRDGSPRADARRPVWGKQPMSCVELFPSRVATRAPRCSLNRPPTPTSRSLHTTWQRQEFTQATNGIASNFSDSLSHPGALRRAGHGTGLLLRRRESGDMRFVALTLVTLSAIHISNSARAAQP